MRGVKGVHDSVIYLDAPHLSWISGYKFALSFEPGLLLLSNKAILLRGAPAPARANDVERRVNEAVCLLFSPTRCFVPFLPSRPVAFFFSTRHYIVTIRLFYSSTAEASIAVRPSGRTFNLQTGGRCSSKSAMTRFAVNH